MRFFLTVLLIGAALFAQQSGLQLKTISPIFKPPIVVSHALATWLRRPARMSIGLDWRASMMANSARDPYWQAAMRRESMDHPESKAAIEDECSMCHMPMQRYETKLAKKEVALLSRLPFAAGTPDVRMDVDGVSCSVCHQITKVKLGTRESFNGGFVIDALKPAGEKNVYGTYKIDDGHKRVMRTSTGGVLPTDSDHIRSSELCATWHTLITQALGPCGTVVGSLPEPMPYQEWLHCDFKDRQSCQSCHMPEVKEFRSRASWAISVKAWGGTYSSARTFSCIAC